MAQYTGALSWKDSQIEISFNSGGAFDDISGWASELQLPPGVRKSGEIYTSDDTYNLALNEIEVYLSNYFIFQYNNTFMLQDIMNSELDKKSKNVLRLRLKDVIFDYVLVSGQFRAIYFETGKFANLDFFIDAIDNTLKRFGIMKP